MIRKMVASTFLLFLPSCAMLYHVQVGDVDGKTPQGKPFSIKVSETGVDLQQAAHIGAALSTKREAQKGFQDLATIIALFQMGPRTGYPVYNDDYAEGLRDMLLKECPSGKMTDLVAIREMRKYPVISGEIVKINGTCLL